MMMTLQHLLLLVIAAATVAHGFSATHRISTVVPLVTFHHHHHHNNRLASPLRMSDNPNPPPFSSSSSSMIDPMSESLVDIETMKQLEKARRAQELREQEVFMKKSTGKHKCSNCDWEYDVTKGDKMMIGGMIAPDTAFCDLPSNWRCPVCRASKDSFVELVEEIPGFEVNQGYGFGANSWSAGQKNLAIFGGLGAFFVLFLSGYAMS